MFDEKAYLSMVDSVEKAEAELTYYAEMEAEDAADWLDHATAHGIYVEPPAWHYGIEPLNDSIAF